MDSNFLPKIHLSVTNAGTPTVNCLVRGKHVHCTAEERVRQRILEWLINEKNWPIEQIAIEKSHILCSNKNRTSLRTDIELLNSDFETQLVVDCKASHIILSELDVRLTIDYAMKSKAKFVWVTNGEDHIFQERYEEHWKAVDSLSILKVKNERQPALLCNPIYKVQSEYSCLHTCFSMLIDNIKFKCYYDVYPPNIYPDLDNHKLQIEYYHNELIKQKIGINIILLDKEELKHMIFDEQIKPFICSLTTREKRCKHAVVLDPKNKKLLDPSKFVQQEKCISCLLNTHYFPRISSESYKHSMPNLNNDKADQIITYVVYIEK